MNTIDLKGHMLSFYTALALGLDKSGNFVAPWDCWESGIHYDGRSFGPFDTKTPYSEPYDFYDVYPKAKALRVSSAPDGDKLRVSLPSGVFFLVDDLLHGYALAIVQNHYGDTVPDTYDCPFFKKTIFLPAYNRPYDETMSDFIVHEA